MQFGPGWRVSRCNAEAYKKVYLSFDDRDWWYCKKHYNLRRWQQELDRLKWSKDIGVT